MCFAPHGGIRHLQGNSANAPLESSIQLRPFPDRRFTFFLVSPQIHPEMWFWDLGGSGSIRNQLAFLCNSPPLLLSLAYPGAYPLEKTDELVKAVWGREDARASSHFSAEPAGEGGRRGGEAKERRRQEKMNMSNVSLHRSVECGSTLYLSSGRPEPMAHFQGVHHLFKQPE